MRRRSEQLHRLPVVAGRRRPVVWGSILVLAGILLPAVPASGEVTTLVTLVLDGRDVTKQHPEALVRFLPRPRKGSDEVPPEIVCAAGRVCSIPPGLYYLEVEDPALIVESRPRMLVEEGDAGSIPVSVTVSRAATLVVPGGHVPVGGSLEALDEKLGVIHARKVDGPVARVRIPGRRVVLCAYDEKKRPLGCQSATAVAGETKSVPGFPRLGRGRGQLLLGLTYPDESAPADVRVVLRSGEERIPPDALVTGRSLRLYAIWYDAPAGAASLELASRHWFVREAGIEVPERGTRVAVGLALARKPKLTVHLEGGEKLGDGDVSVDLFTACPESLVSPELPPPLLFCRSDGTWTGRWEADFSFPDLDPGLKAIRWRKGPLSNARWVDLRDGESRDERLPVEVFEVFGTVRRAGRSMLAEMKWEMGNGVAEVRARTDADGEYRLFVAQPGEWGVGLRDEQGRVFGDACVVASDVRCDFDLPSNVVRARVVDEADRPVAGARIDYEVHGPGPERLRVDVGGEATNDAGLAELPPLRAGLLTLSVRAERFAPATAGPIEITESTTEREVVVRLRDGARLRILISAAGGGPARKARVWSGAYGAVADDDGLAILESPLSPGAPLIAFDLGGAMAFSRFPGGDSFEIRIPRPGPPIQVRFQRPGGTPLPDMGVHLAVDGILDDLRFSEQALAAGGQWSSDAGGRMRVAGLPGQGTLTIYPFGRPDLALTRTLPVLDELVFTVPQTAP